MTHRTPGVDILSQADAARRLGIRPSSVTEALDRGDLSAVTVARRRYVSLASLERFAAKREAIAKAKGAT